VAAIAIYASRMSRLVLVLLLGCAPTTFSFNPTMKGTVARAEGCQWDLLDGPPEEGFEEVGTLAYYNGDVPKTPDAFRSAVARRVCEVGGDAVIADPDVNGEMKSGIVIRRARPR
jgi:hypothetical protein